MQMLITRLLSHSWGRWKGESDTEEGRKHHEMDGVAHPKARLVSLLQATRARRLRLRAGSCGATLVNGSAVTVLGRL